MLASRCRIGRSLLLGGLGQDVSKITQIRLGGPQNSIAVVLDRFHDLQPLPCFAAFGLLPAQHGDHGIAFDRDPIIRPETA